MAQFNRICLLHGHVKLEKQVERQKTEVKDMFIAGYMRAMLEPRRTGWICGSAEG